MTVLEEVSKMRNQGMCDGEIVRTLQDKGTSPRAINDALNQESIKSAVSKEEESQEDYSSPPQYNNETYAKPQEIPEEGEYYPQEEMQNYQGYPQEESYDYSPSQGIDTSTIIEIAEQVFLEKIQKIQKKIDEISEFKTLADSRIESFSERLKKIESMIDNLQLRILEKVGSYGQGIEGIKKEISMMQDSFGKMANALSDNKKVERENLKKEPQKKGGNEDTFQSLRKISRKK